MRNKASWLALALAVWLGALMAPGSAAGQVSSTGLDLTVGSMYGAGGDYVERRGLAATAFLGLHTPVPDWSVGPAAGMEGPLAEPDICTPDGEGGCVPGFPLLFFLGAYAGTERQVHRRVAVGVLAGPAVYWGLDAGRQFGLRGRLDLFLSTSRGAVPFISAGAAAIQAGDARQVWVGSVGIGLRLW